MNGYVQRLENALYICWDHRRHTAYELLASRNKFVAHKIFPFIRLNLFLKWRYIKAQVSYGSSARMAVRAKIHIEVHCFSALQIYLEVISLDVRSRDEIICQIEHE